MSTVKVKNHNKYPISITADAQSKIILVPADVVIEDAGLEPGVTRVNKTKWDAAKKTPQIAKRMTSKGGNRATIEEV